METSMNVDSILLDTPAAEEFGGSYGSATSSGLPVSEFAAGRSAENIDSWQAYLPANCIETMVKLGWDHST
jgi:hypothetical protein